MESSTTDISATKKEGIPLWVSLVDENQLSKMPLLCGYRAVVYQNRYYVIEGYDGDYSPCCYCLDMGMKQTSDFLII